MAIGPKNLNGQPKSRGHVMWYKAMMDLILKV